VRGDIKMGDKVIAEYHFYDLPDILIHEDISEVEPITFNTTSGKARVKIPITTQDVNEIKHRKRVYLNAVNLEIEADIDLDKKDTITNALDREAEEILRRFLRLLRIKISPIPIQIPSRLKYRVNFTSREIPTEKLPQAHHSPITLHGIPIDAGITPENLGGLGNDLKSGKDAEIWQDFLVDAQAASWKGNLIEGVLFAAIACETFIKQYTQKKATELGISKPFWNYICGLEIDVRTKRYFGPILHFLTGHSLEAEDNSLYKSLERLFTHRNKIMHEGKKPLSDNERRQFHEDIQVAQKAISWVKKLELGAPS
jgi:hypothetical protein